MTVVDEERTMLVETTREVLQRTQPAGVIGALHDLGWFELRGDDRPTAEGLLFRIQGEVLATSAALDLVMAEALGKVSTNPISVAGVVLPVPGRGGVAGTVRTDHAVDVDGLLAGPPSDEVIVPLGGGGAVVVPASVFDTSPVEAIDPWSGWRRVRGSVGDGIRRAADWEAALLVGRRALAHELVGVARATLALAVDHVRERRQFGRPVGSFQALQHRLADVEVAVAAAELAADAAWEDADPLPATLAKILAGLAARTAARHCQQACGGMGFTWEHPLHRYVRRGIALDHLLGSATELQAQLGVEIRRSGSIPRLVHL